jgi:flagellar FliL protein
VADEEKTPTEEPIAPAKRGGALMLPVILVVSLAAGGSVGTFVIGPMVGPDVAATGEAKSGKPEGGHGESSGGGHGDGAAESPLYSIENLVVNPAGTQGTRFLVASIAVQMKDAGDAKLLTERDAEVRDVILHLLGSRSVEQLSNLASRDTLKQDVRTAIETVIGSGKVVRIFVPQFVLQ